MLKIPPNTIDIWLTDERQITDPGVLDTYAGFLSQDEARRHQRFVFNQHQHQFLVARALVRSVLAQYVGEIDPAAVAFQLTDLGKPELTNDVGLQFNLSHTPGLIALAVMKKHPLGIDVEHLSRQSDIVRLADRYFSRLEYQGLKALPVSEWNNRFYDLWTLKEAYLKACGTGLRTPLDAFSFRLEDKRIGIEFTPHLADDPQTWHFRQLAVEGGFRLSLAVKAEDVGPYTLVVRRGCPLQPFATIEQQVVRSSASIH